MKFTTFHSETLRVHLVSLNKSCVLEYLSDRSSILTSKGTERWEKVIDKYIQMSQYTYTHRGIVWIIWLPYIVSFALNKLLD